MTRSVLSEVCDRLHGNGMRWRVPHLTSALSIRLVLTDDPSRSGTALSAQLGLRFAAGAPGDC
jgi:hypothetical protein